MVESMRRIPLGKSEIEISVVGLGCMGLSEFYGMPVSETEGCRLIHHGLDRGINFFDTADMYGNGHNERLLAAAFKGQREKAVIATKFGIVREGKEYAREISGKPEYVRAACHESLRRLNTDYIDLYYIHRVDSSTPIEDTVGEMARLLAEGKIRALGICEPSPETLCRAHAEYPMSAIQSEYSMLTRDPEEAILSLSGELQITFVPYSPICRGLLSTGKISSDDPADVRKFLPRFQGHAYESNKNIAERLSLIAKEKGCTLAQLSLAWAMAQGKNIVPIPGTTKTKNLDSNIEATQVRLSTDDLAMIDEVLESSRVEGERYTVEGMKGVNV